MNQSSTLPILSLHEVSVARGEIVLCQRVNLGILSGDICHIIGENGLGKTTLLHQIIGLLPTHQGEIRHTSKYAPICILHQTGIHDALTVKQNLVFLANLHGVRPNDKQISEALDNVGLFGYDDAMTAKLSAGQNKRVGLARLFLSLPSQLWVLDEPFTALDTVMIDVLQHKIHQFVQAGGAVVMTSHQPVKNTTKTLDLSAFTH